MATRFVGVTGILIFTAILAACGGSSNSSNSSPTHTGSSSTSTRAGSPAATASKSSSGSGSGDLGDVKAALAKFQGATFKANYTTTLGTTGAQAITDAKLSIVKDGAKLRFDINGKQNGADVSIAIIDADSTSVFCLKGVQGLTRLLGSADAGGVCFKSDATTAGFNPGTGIRNALARFEASDVTLVDKTNRTIAGTNATCYQTQKAGETTTSTVCLSSDGALLYGKSSGASANEITATDVSGSVSSSDFSPPYAVRDFPVRVPTP